MALAKYFSKDVLAITQVLNKGGVDIFSSLLNVHVIEIAFDTDVLFQEGKASIDLLIKLASRLYPKLKFTSLNNLTDRYVKQFENLAKNINNKIDIVTEPSTIIIVIGKTSVVSSSVNTPIFYVGSNNWMVYFSNTQPVGSGDSLMPFAAGAAACIAAANIFRYVFNSLIEAVEYDSDICLSLISLEENDTNPKLTISDIGDVVVVGLGAVGNGVLWSLSNLATITGKISFIDHEFVSLSNLQRYVECEELDEGKLKVELANEKLAHGRFVTEGFAMTWKDYIAKHKDFENSMVLCGVDSAKGRIGIQSSLPKQILNGFTEQGLLGVSRHINFLDNACIGCMYIPTENKKSKSQEVAENLGIPHLEKDLVRPYLYYDFLVDENILKQISLYNNINQDELKRFIGIPMSKFYSDFVCGGILLTLKQKEDSTAKIETPLAFQSAFAGILLVSELFLIRGGIRDGNFKNVTHFYPLLPIQNGINPYNHTLSKNKGNNCFCLDKLFVEAYKGKYL